MSAVSVLLFIHLYAAAKLQADMLKHTSHCASEHILLIYCTQGNTVSAHTLLINSVSRGPNVSL